MEPSKKGFNTDALFESVRATQKDIDAAGLKSGAERWSVHSDYRRKLWEMVRQHYCLSVGVDAWEFPYSEDGVALVHVRIRKRKDK